jgi:hypothetical protein
MTPEDMPDDRLDFQAGMPPHGGGDGGGVHNVVIERVEVRRAEGRSDPDTCAAIERLLARWMVRAYLRKYGGGEESGQLPDPLEAVA